MAKLIVNPQSPGRKEIDLPQAGISIGRDPANDIVIADALVSRHHAQIVFSGEGYILRDCNSSNGSLVNGDRVTEQPLHDGDVVWLGASRLVFRGDGAPTEGNLAKIIQHPSSPRLACPACQNPYKYGDIYCRHCGAELEKHPAFPACPGCAARIIGPAQFCNSCGANLLAPRSDREALPRSQRPPRPSEPAPAPAAAAPVSSVSSLSLASGAALPDARLEHRLLAAMIDGLFAMILSAVFLTPAAMSAIASSSPLASAGALALIGAAGFALATYFIAFPVLRGATPGKELLGLAIVRKDTGAPLGFRDATLRFMGYFLSAIPLGLGFLMAAVDGETMHDRFAGTRVVQRP